MKKSIKYIVVLLFIVFSGQNLYSGELKTTVWFKSGQEICLDNFIIGKYVIKDSQNNVEFEYNNIDSLFTKSRLIADELIKKHKVLAVENRKQGFLITGFENIVHNILNINIEVGGRAIAGGLNIGFVYDQNHSFDLCYADLPESCGRKANARKLISFNYSYLFGDHKYKLELGTGFSHGKILRFKNCGTPEQVTDVYEGFMVHCTLGFRYQCMRNGPLLKAGITPVLFIDSHIYAQLFYYVGFGYTFGVNFP